MITVSLMTCGSMYSLGKLLLFCSFPVTTRKEISFRQKDVVTLEAQPYEFLPKLTYKAVLEASKNSKQDMVGCKINLESDKELYYEFPCSDLLKVIKSQKCD